VQNSIKIIKYENVLSEFCNIDEYYVIDFYNGETTSEQHKTTC
jgi:hypothetical protein